jgi:hypothetical protein
MGKCQDVPAMGTFLNADIEETIRVVIKAIPKSRLIVVSREWQRRIDECIKNKGNYFE